MNINGWNTAIINAHKAKPSPIKYYPPYQRNNPKLLNSNCQYIGVTQGKTYPGVPPRYQSRIKLNGKSQSLGAFPDERSAAWARDSHIISNNLLGYKLNDFEDMH